MSESLRCATTVPTVVFLHGWGASAQIWQNFTQNFPAAFECWDLPGFESSAISTPKSLTSYLNDCVEHLPAPCVLVGWSLGGMLATRLASMAPEKVVGLVTLATNPKFVASDNWPEGMAPEVFNAFVSGFQAAPQKTFQRFCALQAKGDCHAKAVMKALKTFEPTSAQVQAWSEALGWLAVLDNREALAQLKLPQLHLFGKYDALVSNAVAKRLEANAGARAVVISHMGHCLPLDSRGQCRALIMDFLQRWQGIDKTKIASSFGEAASRYDAAALVQRTVAQQLVEMIGDPPTGAWLDLGAGTGFVGQAIENRFGLPDVWVNGDLSLGMLQQCRKKGAPSYSYYTGMDAEQLPVAKGVLDGVVSSLTLQWVSRLDQCMEALFEVLKPGGRLVFSTLVTGSLCELKRAWLAVDPYIHVNHFLSVDAVLRAVRGAGFQVVRQEASVVEDAYPDVPALLRSLKNIGAHNMNAGQKKGLTTKAQFQALQQAYQTYQTPGQQFPVTYSVLMITASKNGE